MSDIDLLYTPAAKAAALFRARKLSPVEYVDAVLKAADKANGKLNCFRVIMHEEARRDARAAEEAVGKGSRLGPLHGVPISIKDLVDVKGVPTRHGSAIYADNPPAAADDVLVQRLRAAGAIIFAKASTPEFGVKGLTDPIHGEDEDELGEDDIVPFHEEEKRLLGRALKATKGNVRRAAQLLGIGRATLYRKIQIYQLRLQ